MIVELGLLEGDHLDFAFDATPDEVALNDESARLEKPVHVAGRLTKGIVRTEIAARIDGEIVFECTRCLKPLVKELDVPFTAGFITEEYYGANKESELSLADLDDDVFDGSRIDLTDVVREQILLSLPEQVFCREDCKGLCANCGADLNLTDCNCHEDGTDPRWAALRNLG